MQRKLSLTSHCPNLTMFWPSLLMFFGVVSLPTHGSNLSFLWTTLECVTATIRQNQNKLWNDRCTHGVTYVGVQCDKDYFNGTFLNLCSMFKVMVFILKRCINMAKIIVHHEMFNVRRGSFRWVFNLTIFIVVIQWYPCWYPTCLIHKFREYKLRTILLFLNLGLLNLPRIGW